MSGSFVGIRIYLEGGGSSDANRFLRVGMDTFLRDLKNCAARKQIGWQIIACGPRGKAFRNFERALGDHPDSLNILLVDSEIAVTAAPWQHLQQHDGWKQPRGTAPDQCHLMVQCMEAWFVADPAALAVFYGSGFTPPIRAGRAIQAIDKARLFSMLNTATRTTTKGAYHKIRHGTALLKKIDPAKVRAASPHCETLFTALEARLGGC